MIEVTVKRWDDLVNEVFEDSYNQDLGRFRSPYAFRGQPADYPLVSSLMRLDHAPPLVPQIEEYLFRSFRKYAHHEVTGHNSDWRWLSIAQHHGLPTRLLDWTYSPFVAMHFATAALHDMAKDGVIWCVNFHLIQRYLPPPLRRAIGAAQSGVFNVEMLEERFKDYRQFDLQKGGLDAFVLFFEPPSLDPRIVNQVALFSFMSRPDVRLDEWLIEKAKTEPKVCKKIIFTGDELKWEIRDKLDQANINERVLFPVLDGLSSWLKRWYSPKSPVPAPDPAQQLKPGRKKRGMS
jgi:FRG domain